MTYWETVSAIIVGLSIFQTGQALGKLFFFLIMGKPK